MPSKIDKEIKDTSFENLNTELLKFEKNRYHQEGGHKFFTEKYTTNSRINPGP